MRQIGHLPNAKLAKRFADFLVTLGINAHTEEEGNSWAVWVREEEHVQKATSELKQFLVNPDDSSYTRAASQAEKIRREDIEQRRKAAKNVVDIRGNWGTGGSRNAPAVFVLIAACVVVFMLTGMGMNNQNRYVQMLKFVSPTAPGYATGKADPFYNIQRGEVWRLVTPIFLHGDTWHLVFNMFAFWMFGSQIEDRRGTLRFVLLVLLGAIIPNIAQVLLGGVHINGVMLGGYNFGGMSGVVYALFGYIWMKSAFDRSMGFQVSRTMVVVLIAWFFLGFANLENFPAMANAAHGGGLLVGVVVGYLPVIFPGMRNVL